MTEERLTTLLGEAPVRRLQTQTTIAASIEVVWNALTDGEDLAHWWTGGTIDKKEGGRIVLDDGSEVNGTIKTYFPPYIFEFTWNDSPADAGHPEFLEFKTKSLVRFDLVELGDSRTLMTLVQYAPAASAAGAAAGWHQIAGERLRDYLENGAAEEHPKRFEELVQLYGG